MRYTPVELLNISFGSESAGECNRTLGQSSSVYCAAFANTAVQHLRPDWKLSIFPLYICAPSESILFALSLELAACSESTRRYLSNPSLSISKIFFLPGGELWGSPQSILLALMYSTYIVDLVNRRPSSTSITAQSPSTVGPKSRVLSEDRKFSPPTPPILCCHYYRNDHGQICCYYYSAKACHHWSTMGYTHNHSMLANQAYSYSRRDVCWQLRVGELSWKCTVGGEGLEHVDRRCMVCHRDETATLARKNGGSGRGASQVWTILCDRRWDKRDAEVYSDQKGYQSRSYGLRRKWRILSDVA